VSLAQLTALLDQLGENLVSAARGDPDRGGNVAQADAHHST